MENYNKFFDDNAYALTLLTQDVVWRHFNVMDVETTLCAYWEMSIYTSSIQFRLIV